jgi:hypothetical protein
VATNEMDKKPNQASVEAWADSVGDAFDKGGALIDLIPEGWLPGFITDYWKGLFSAPKSYITAFKAIMHAHYDNIDITAGVASGDHLVEEPGHFLGGVVWRGELSTIYQSAFFQQKSKDGSTLQQFMKNHQKTEGADLWQTKKEFGAAMLLGAISRDAPEEVKTSWAAYVGSA